MPIIKGEARFWKALDETVDPKSIKEVQEHLQDEQPNEFELRHRTIDFTLD